MGKKSVIIIPNEQYVKIPLYVKSCKLHSEGIQNFVFQNDINLFGKEYSYSFQEIAFELAEQDYLVMGYDEIENMKNLIIYLPNRISPKQLEYFEKRKEGLKDYNLMFYSHTEDNKIKMYDNTTTSVPIIDELMKELKLKLSNKKHIKKLEKIEN
jgi:hypothetical protein